MTSYHIIRHAILRPSPIDFISQHDLKNMVDFLRLKSLITDLKIYMYCGRCAKCFVIAVENTYLNFCRIADDEFPFVHDIFISNSNEGCFPSSI